MYATELKPGNNVLIDPQPDFPIRLTNAVLFKRPRRDNARIVIEISNPESSDPQVAVAVAVLTTEADNVPLNLVITHPMLLRLASPGIGGAIVHVSGLEEEPLLADVRDHPHGALPLSELVDVNDLFAADDHPDNAPLAHLAGRKSRPGNYSDSSDDGGSASDSDDSSEGGSEPAGAMKKKRSAAIGQRAANGAATGKNAAGDAKRTRASNAMPVSDSEDSEDANEEGDDDEEPANAAKGAKPNSNQQQQQQKNAAQAKNEGKKRRAKDEDKQAAAEADGGAAAPPAKKKKKNTKGEAASGSVPEQAQQPAKAGQKRPGATENAVIKREKGAGGSSSSGATLPLIEHRSGMKYRDMITGVGKRVQRGHFVALQYTLRLENGRVIDKADRKRPFKFRVGIGECVKGFDLGVMGMREGGERHLIVPPELGYGSQNLPGIPAGSTLFFDISVVKAF